MPIQVQGPDGQRFEFPDGTHEAIVSTAIRNHYSGATQQGGGQSQAHQDQGPWTQYQGKAQAADGPWTQYQQGGSKFGGVPVEQGSKFGGVPVDPREELTALRRMAELEDKSGSKVYQVTAPDGRKLRITAPEGATQDDVLAYAQSNYQVPARAEGSGSRLQAIEHALRAADAAGNTQDARKLAQAYAAERDAQQAPGEGTTPGRMKLSAVTGKPDFSNVTGGVQTMQRQRAPVPYSGPMLAPSRTADRAPAPPTLEQINAANRAERQKPGYAADQQRIAMENKRTEFNALPAPARFLVGTGQRVAQAGRGVGQIAAWAMDKAAPQETTLVSLVTGNNSSRYEKSLAQEAQARQRDAYMQGDTAAALGGFAGDVGLTLAPGGAVGRLGGLRAIAGSAALGGAYAGMQPVIAGESRADNAKMGAAFGAGGQAVGAGLSAVGRNAARAVPAEIRQMVTRARELGIPVHASQVSQSLPVKVAASAGKYLPFSGYGKAATAQQLGANRAVSRTFGANADKLTDDVMRTSRRRLSGEFEDVFKRNDVPITANGARKLAQVESQAMRRLTGSQGQVLRNQLDDILANADHGVLTGHKYQAVRTALKKAEGDDKLGVAVRELRQALDDIAAQAVGPKDAAKLKALRSQWANFRTAENALKQNAGAGGDIKLSALWPLIRKGSTQEMRELARMGQTLLKDPISDSGTAQRTFAYNLLMGGGSIANPALIPVFAKAALGGATVGRAANSPALAKLLAREGRGVPTSKLGRLLEKTNPVLAPALVQQYGGGGR